MPNNLSPPFLLNATHALPPERFHVALVAGSGSVALDDFYQHLLRRLRVSATIMAVGLGILFGFTLLHLWDLSPSGRLHVHEMYHQIQGVVSLRGLLAIVSAVTALLLWCWPPSSVRGLRRIEDIVLGVFATVLILNGILGYWFLPSNPTSQDPSLCQGLTAWYVYRQTLYWFCLIAWYGTLIPNTWRRATAVVGVLALTPLVLFAVHALWLRPLPDEVDFGGLFFIQALFIGLAAAIALFSSSRIEVLRQQAAEARKLGQYMLKEKLGAGGMGEVYRAEHVLLRRPCALKLIRPERAGDPKNRRRFEREVQVTATLTHPNTVQIYDYGHTADGTFYYVMEYLPGQSLEQLVKQHGPLPPARVVHLLRQVCGALREAHAAGLIHRDIKPSNIIVCERGGLSDVAKLLDFGIVDAPDPNPGGALTLQGQLLGTPAFMSAEQAAGASDLDARSDLYSLAATAYFILTGKAPFERGTTNLIIAAHLRDPVTPPHFLRTEIPIDLSGVIKRCLEKDPSQRYADAASLEKALAQCKCADQWTEDRAIKAQHEKATSYGAQPISETGLEHQWGF